MSAGNEREFIDLQQLEERRKQAMKCPRTFQIEITEDDQIKLVGADCIKEACAWWNEHNNECSFISTGKVLNAISTYLYEIKDKMPHAGQFTK